MIPHDPTTRLVTTDEIAKRLGGRVVGSTQSVREVRHFIVGALGTEASLRSFRRTPDLGVITGADRTEILAAAVEVPNLRCLIVTGSARPKREIVEHANAANVPIIQAGQNTMTTAAVCSEMLERVWIHPGETLERAIAHVDVNIDVDRILEKAQET